MPTDSPSHDVSMRIIRNFPSNTHTHTHTHTHRVAKLVSYFLYIVHIYTCIFYAVSKSEGLESMTGCTMAVAPGMAVGRGGD